MKKIITIVATLGILVAGAKFNPTLANESDYGDLEPAYPAIPAEIRS